MKFIFIDIPGSILILCFILGWWSRHNKVVKTVFFDGNEPVKSKPITPKRIPVPKASKPKLYIVRDQPGSEE